MSTQHASRVNGDTRFLAGADIHSHILPGIDDGADSLDASLLMAAVAMRYGTTLMSASPHRYYGGRENTPAVIRALTERVRAALQTRPWPRPFELRAGQEIPLTLLTGEELQSGAVLTLGDTGVYALVEPPFERLPGWSARAIAGIVTAGFRPVLAHPERNADIQTRPEQVRELVAAGARVQLTAMSVTGLNGPRALAAANWMLDSGLASAISSDCHSAGWRPPNLRGAFHAVRDRLGLREAERLCRDNPRAMIYGADIAEGGGC